MDKRINDLTEKQILDSTDLFIVETNSGTKKIQYSNLIPNISHNAIFRGKNLGTITSSNIDDFMNSHEVSLGEFTDLYLGDYFTSNYNGRNTIFRIAGFDIYLNQGKNNNRITDHHLVIVPDSSLGSAPMNSTDTTGISENPNNPVGISAGNQLGGFAGSDMFQITLPTVNTRLEAIFGNHLLSYSHKLSNFLNEFIIPGGITSSSGASDNWEWYNVKANLMSEIEVYGTRIWSSSGFDSGSSVYQLPLFRLEPRFINLIYRFWLRDVCDHQSFVIHMHGCPAPNCPASMSDYIRPKFLLV